MQLGLSFRRSSGSFQHYPVALSCTLNARPLPQMFEQQKRNSLQKLDLDIEGPRNACIPPLEALYSLQQPEESHMAGANFANFSGFRLP